ncbi:MAG: ImmA/IrrE family metallo-endopeptidase, partial [Acidimicrobiales bacterium]
MVRRGLLAPAARSTTFTTPSTYEDAENLARSARAEVGAADGPLLEIQALAEQLGLLAFSIALRPDGGDAAYVETGNVGVAIVNGSTDPGRRRFSLAHELGHHLVGDAYEPTPRLGAATDTERLLNTFAAYLLVPRSAAVATWNECSHQSSRHVAVALAVRFRVSWTVACNQL